MNKQQLAAKIWESANKMRSKIEANEYKDYILGFIFYKFLSDKEVKFFLHEGFTEADIKKVSEKDKDTVKYTQDNIGYFIAYSDLFDTWLGKGRNFDVSDVRDALSAFSRLISPSQKRVFGKIFDTLQTGLSKLGDSSGTQTKAISDLLQLIKDIPMDGKQDYDVLGFIYEYLISMFAANAGKKAGEFYTPHEVSLLMSEIVADHLKNRKEIKIYDPTSGSGSLLINIGHSIAKHIDNPNNIKYYAQELKENTYNLTRMNLVMRGILADNIVTRNGDTLEDDWPYFDDNDPINTYNPLYVDAVVSNPPYSQNWDPSNKEADPRFSRFGLAPKAKADYAFLLHDLFHLKPDGIMNIVLPHGVLFRGGEERGIRKNLIESNHIDTIIGLPANIFFGTSIPTIIMVLKQKRADTDVLIIDASKGFAKEGKNNKLRACDIKKISDTVRSRASINKFSRLVSREEIRTNDYNLNIPRYVDSSEGTEQWDLYASMFGGIPKAEIDALAEYWEALPDLKKTLFKKSGGAYAQLAAKDIKETVRNHPDVAAFKESFNEAIKPLGSYLKKELVADTDSVPLAKEETVLADRIFKKLETVPLIDKYKAYQALDDEWSKISADLEILQTEGFKAAKKVDPLMVLKKKNGKDEEVQDGWAGHVIPFELVQQTVLKKEASALKKKEERIAEIDSAFNEILDSLSEEEKDSEALNDAKDAFVNAWVTREAKHIKAEQKKGCLFEEDSFENKLLQVDALITEEKELKALVSKESGELQAKTKTTIEKLSDEDLRSLLEQKWIDPLLKSLSSLPDECLDTLTEAVQTLSEKYSTTYQDIESQIDSTEKELCAQLADLTGSEFDQKGIEALRSLLKGEGR